MASASSAGAGAHPEVTAVVTLWAAKSDAHECPGGEQATSSGIWAKLARADCVQNYLVFPESLSLHVAPLYCITLKQCRHDAPVRLCSRLEPN